MHRKFSRIIVLFVSILCLPASALCDTSFLIGSWETAPNDRKHASRMTAEFNKDGSGEVTSGDKRFPLLWKSLKDADAPTVKLEFRIEGNTVFKEWRFVAHSSDTLLQQEDGSSKRVVVWRRKGIGEGNSVNRDHSIVGAWDIVTVDGKPADPKFDLQTLAFAQDGSFQFLGFDANGGIKKGGRRYRWLLGSDSKTIFLISNGGANGLLVHSLGKEELQIQMPGQNALLVYGRRNASAEELAAMTTPRKKSKGKSIVGAFDDLVRCTKALFAKRAAEVARGNRVDKLRYEDCVHEKVGDFVSPRPAEGKITYSIWSSEIGNEVVMIRSPAIEGGKPRSMTIQASSL